MKKISKHLASFLYLKGTITAFIFLICLFPELGFAQDSSFRFTEIMAIGDDEKADVEYLLAGPRHVSTDSSGNIYVADGRIPEIRLFSESGNYIKTIGQQGQGPGEFAQISAITINEESGNLIVADNTNGRFTIFSDLDAPPQTVSYPSDRLEIGELHAFDQSYLAVAFDYERLDAVAKAAPFGHILSEDLSTIIASAARSDAWWDLTEPFLQAQQPRVGVIVAPEDENSFLLVPEFYEGQIYRYQRQSGGDWKWQTLQGREEETPPYRLHETDNPTQAPNPKRLYNGAAGRFVASIYRVSVGLFTLSDGRIVHFTYEKGHGNDSSLYIELFDADGQLIKTGPVEGYAQEGVSAFGTKVLWKDERDRFYIVDKRGDFPILRIVRLEG